MPPTPSATASGHTTFATCAPRNRVPSLTVASRITHLYICAELKSASRMSAPARFARCNTARVRSASRRSARRIQHSERSVPRNAHPRRSAPSSTARLRLKPSHTAPCRSAPDSCNRSAGLACRHSSTAHAPLRTMSRCSVLNMGIILHAYTQRSAAVCDSVVAMFAFIAYHLCVTIGAQAFLPHLYSDWSTATWQISHPFEQ